MDLELALGSLVEAAPWLSFAALIRLIESLVPTTANDEVLRFQHEPSPIFHGGEIAALRVLKVRGALRVEVTTTFLGVVGTVSPLASHFTEAIIRAEADGERATRDFYDVVHHRLLGLLFRTLERASPAWEIRSTQSDRTTTRSLSLLGLAAESSPVSPHGWLASARVLGTRPGTRASLEAGLRASLPGQSFRVCHFVMRDIEVPLPQRTRLGGSNATLGRDARLGRVLQKRSGMIRLETGPANRDALVMFLPGGAYHKRLRSLVATLVPALDVELEVVIAPGEEPHAHLDGKTRLGASALLMRGSSLREPLRLRVSLTCDEDAARPQFLWPSELPTPSHGPRAAAGSA